MNSSVLLCMGTRPEIIKMAPVYTALVQRGIDAKVLHTGQHGDVAEVLYEFFGIQPTMRLVLQRRNNSLAELSAQLKIHISDALQTIKPKAVLVHGDTSSALIAALCSFYEKIPVGHVEAGLRTHTFYDPFPEEKNRELIGRLAQWHFAPTQQAVRNLICEGLQTGIHMTGNTVIDAAISTLARLNQLETLPQELKGIPDLVEMRVGNHKNISQQKRLILITAHRRENWGKPIQNIAKATLSWLKQDQQSIVVWPLHPNPLVAEGVRSAVRAERDIDVLNRIHLISPVDYPALIWLLKNAWIIATDSGGIQEEASAFSKRILVLRETTERPEALECGLGQLTGTDPDKILRELTSALIANAQPLLPLAKNPFGDGKASERIAEQLIRDMKLKPQPLKQAKAT